MVRAGGGVGVKSFTLKVKASRASFKGRRVSELEGSRNIMRKARLPNKKKPVNGFFRGEREGSYRQEREVAIKIDVARRHRCLRKGGDFLASEFAAGEGTKKF